MEIDEHLKYTLYADPAEKNAAKNWNDIVLTWCTACSLILAREPASRWFQGVRFLALLTSIVPILTVCS